MKKKTKIALIATTIIILGIILILMFQDNNQMIGGKKDKHGCLISAGYSYDKETNTCIREWEISEEEKKAVKIATENYEKPVTIIKVENLKCQGCYKVTLRTKPDSENAEITIKNWDVTTNEKNPGEKQRNYCTPESKKADFCTQEYAPVCGWYNKEFNCIKYPCAETYSNQCHACKDEKVEYWTQGECPN